MDYQKTLTQLQEGSKSQRRRKQELDKQKKERLAAWKKKKSQKTEQQLHDTIDAQLQYCSKIQEGNTNSLRTLEMRLFFVRFQDKTVYNTLKEVKKLMIEFGRLISQYEAVIEKKDWKQEEQHNKDLTQILKFYEHKKKQIEQQIRKQKDSKHQAHLMLGNIILTTTLLLFKEAKEIPYDKKIFEPKKSYNPLNPLYPLTLP